MSFGIAHKSHIIISYCFDVVYVHSSCCITLILMLLGYAIYVYLDKNDFFDEVKPEPTSITKESTPFPKIKPGNFG